MLEAMLFGYEKGAFTGAYASAPGKFEQANGGTLLLDEISEMDMSLQAKLLRVLQEKEVERLGGRKVIPLDVRVIATSNRDIQQQIATGKFREDLYYRLSVLPLQWKPLRERREDILPLASRLLQKHAVKQSRTGIRLDESAQRALFDYNWPGNVRELDNVMQRAMILQAGSLIRDEDLGLDMLSIALSQPAEVTVFQAINNVDGLHHSVNSQAGDQASEFGYSVNTAAVDKPTQLGDDLKQREFEIIVATLKEEKGSRKNTAQRLGVSPRTLRYKLAKMRELGLQLNGVTNLT
jgi:two-component system response regulator FlrC